MVERVNSSYHSPRNLVPLNWGTSGTAWVGAGGGTNPFSTFATDPNSGKFPIWYATARTGIDGQCTIGLTNGFTASSGSPITLYVWEYNRVAQAWLKLGGNLAQYSIAVDATYILATFNVSENVPILIQSSSAITGSAYTDGMIDASVVGPPQEG